MIIVSQFSSYPENGHDFYLEIRSSFVVRSLYIFTPPNDLLRMIKCCLGSQGCKAESAVVNEPKHPSGSFMFLPGINLIRDGVRRLLLFRFGQGTKIHALHIAAKINISSIIRIFNLSKVHVFLSGFHFDKLQKYSFYIFIQFGIFTYFIAYSYENQNFLDYTYL